MSQKLARVEKIATDAVPSSYNYRPVDIRWRRL